MPAKPLTPDQLEDAARLKAIFEQRKKQVPGLTQETLAEACGWRTQGSVNQYLNGKIPLNPSAAAKFAKALGVSIKDFSTALAAQIYELSEPTSNSASVRELEVDYGIPKFLIRRAETNISPGPDVQGMIPLISWVTAGSWNPAADPLPPGYAEDWLPMPKKNGKHSYALRVRGDSMTSMHGKSYPDGCIIFVDPDKRSPVTGDRIIAKLDGSDEVTFKQFVSDAGRVWLKPLNPQYPVIHDEFRVLGTIIGKWEDE